MILDIIKPATVPARNGFGRNHESASIHIWRLEDGTGTLRVACHLGEFSVWQEGAEERELFRINLGVLSEIARRARNKAWAYRRSLPGIRELTEEETMLIWRACASDPEVRFSASLRKGASSMGGWRRCLELAGILLRMQGRPVPWERAEFVEHECAA